MIVIAIIVYREVTREKANPPIIDYFKTISETMKKDSVFPKGGNNGTVSCNTFCSGVKWGEVGWCTQGGYDINTKDLIPCDNAVAFRLEPFGILKNVVCICKR